MRNLSLYGTACQAWVLHWFRVRGLSPALPISPLRSGKCGSLASGISPELGELYSCNAHKYFLRSWVVEEVAKVTRSLICEDGHV